MECVAKVHRRCQPLHLSLHHHRPSFSRPISSLSFRTPSPSSSSSSLSIRASSSPSPSPSPSPSSSFSDPNLKNPKATQFTPNPFPFSLLKTTAIAAVAAAAVLFARFNLKPLVSFAAISPPVSAAETAAREAGSDEEKERTLEEYASSHPDDVQALRSLMEAKIKNRKVDEAIAIVEQLIGLEPEDVEWPLLKGHLHRYNGDLEMAKLGFNEILEKDPFRVEAYHGLVMTVSEADSDFQLKEIEKRLVEAMESCKREKKKDDLRDLKLLIAQIRVIEGNYSDALKIYQELVREEPRDFRPHLCQGIIYTLLRKKDEAEKHFQKYRRLVPKEHPYAQYFDDNMIATKVFAQKVENERMTSKS